MSPQEPILSARNLTKRYGRVVAIDNADFDLMPGEILAVIGDNAASAVGTGVVRAGEAFVSLGTSGVLFAATERYAPNTGDAVHTFCHAVPQTWHQMGVILSATDSMTWLSEITGKAVPDLAALVPETVATPSPALFLPYLSGERTPLNDPDATGAFLGLRRASGLGDLAQIGERDVAGALLGAEVAAVDVAIERGADLRAVECRVEGRLQAIGCVR